jgi:hypothetical protein
MITASIVGKRLSNDDSVLNCTWKYRHRRYYSLTICDGVGSQRGSGECALQVAKKVRTALKTFLKRRRSRKPFSIGDNRVFSDHVKSALTELSGSDNQSTTLASIVFNDRSYILLWAGDSRIYILLKDGVLTLLTTSHHDQEGNINRYITGVGRVVGGTDTLCGKNDNFIAFIICTDGVYTQCTSEELRQFIFFCIANRITDQNVLCNELEAFLERNLSDNASMGIAYRPVSISRLKQLSGIGL